MDFEQVAPRRAEASDGTVVELADRFHAQLHGPQGMWMVELGPTEDDDWMRVTVFRDSLLRAGGDPQPDAHDDALARIVAGLRALRMRVSVGEALDGSAAQPAD